MAFDLRWRRSQLPWKWDIFNATVVLFVHDNKWRFVDKGGLYELGNIGVKEF